MHVPLPSFCRLSQRQIGGAVRCGNHVLGLLLSGVAPQVGEAATATTNRSWEEWECQQLMLAARVCSLTLSTLVSASREQRLPAVRAWHLGQLRMRQVMCCAAAAVQWGHQGRGVVENEDGDGCQIEVCVSPSMRKHLNVSCVCATTVLLS